MSEEKQGKVHKRFNEIGKIKKEKDNGKLFCLPFDSYPKLSTLVPGVIPGMIQMVTAASGIGKTQVTKAIYVREALESAKRYNVKIKIIYFALEESEEEFLDSMICNYVSNHSNIRMDMLKLQGFRKHSLAEEEMDEIGKHVNALDNLLEDVEIVDSIYNPTGIYKYCRNIADRNGTHFWVDKEFIKKKKDGKTYKEVEKVYSHYVPNDPNAITIVVVDHLSLLAPEKDNTGRMLTQHQTMAKWSTDYALKQITKHWNWAVVNVQQQEQSQEGQQFTNKGDSIQEKTEPSLAGLANNKELQRDAKVILGVYSPDRYGFTEYHHYDIGRFRDSFRAVKVLKNRFGPPNKYIHFLFDGATNRFKELPKSSETAKLVPYYLTADKLNNRKTN